MNPAPPSGRSRPARTRLYAGSSLACLGLALSPAPALAAALPGTSGFGTSGYFTQLQSRNAASSAGVATQTLPLPALARTLAARSAADLAAAAQAITAAETAQATARAKAAAAEAKLHITEGLGAGGLVVAPNPNGDPNLWQGAAQPTETTSGGQTTVTIDQTAQKAILTWSSFNVGPNTTVHFDQSAGTDSSGNNAWIALNRIGDSAPSQIYGAIKAEGTVYLINANGVVFDGTAQVDLHALIASALDIGQAGQTTALRNAQFLQQGLAIPAAATQLPAYTAADVSFSSVNNLDAAAPEESVTVAPGAEITTGTFKTVTSGGVTSESFTPGAFPPDNPGTVMLLGASVANAGIIDVPSGQAILGAGREVAFKENTTVDTATGVDFLGLQIVTERNLLEAGANNSSQYDSWDGTVDASNAGLIETPRGNITLNGKTVEDDGVLSASTSITRNGSVLLEGQASAELGPLAVSAGAGLAGAPASGVIAILPDENGETIPQGQISSATFSAPYIDVQAFVQLSNGASFLPVPGIGTVDLGPGSTIVSPGGTVGIVGGQSVTAEQSSLIDVAGLTTTVLPMSSNLITLSPRGPELADSPLQRHGVLRGQQIVVDSRITGTTSAGIAWVGTPLAAVAGYVATDVTDNIDQLLSTGGSVSIATEGLPGSSPPSTGTLQDAILLRPGSTIDTSGGYVSIAGGIVATTRLMGADGQIYNIADADPNLIYTGLAGQFSQAHSQWNVTDTYKNPVLTGSAGNFEPGYIVGKAAGSLSLNADAIVADGSLYGQAVAGQLQRTAGSIPAAGAISFSASYSQYLDVQQAVGQTPASVADLVSTTPLADENVYPLSGVDPGDRADTLVLSTQILNAGGFRSISASGTTIVAPGADLTVVPGGSIALSGAYLDIQGTLTAPAGKISLTALGNARGNPITGDPANPAATAITIAPGARLDVAGLWVNDTGLFNGTAEGPADINGGSISLLSEARAYTPKDSAGFDTTGGIVVAPAATLDLTAGGYVSPAGAIATSGGVPEGSGGSLTLETYVGGFGANPNLAFTPNGDGLNNNPLTASLSIDLARSVQAFGFAGGGTLTLQVGPSIAISANAGNAIATAPDGTLIVPAAMFGTASGTGNSFWGTGNPFGAFNLQSDDGSVTVAANIVLRQSNLQPTAASATLATGGDVYGRAADGALLNPVGLTIDALRKPTDLTLGPGNIDIGFYPDAAATSGTLTLGAGASIAADPSAVLSLTGAYRDLIEGTIVAPSGSVTLEAGINAAQTPELDGQTVADGAIYLAPSSRIDLAGTTVLNAANLLYTSGTVLPGGSLNLVATESRGSSFGYVVAAPGSEIDLDGAAGQLQYLSADPSGVKTTALSETVASDAGALTVTSVAAYLDGTVLATGGAPNAANGILSVGTGSSFLGDIVVQNKAEASVTEAAIAGAASGATLAALFTDADKVEDTDLFTSRLDRTAFDDIRLGGPSLASTTAGPSQIVFKAAGKAGRVSLDARRAVLLGGPILVSAGTVAAVDSGYLTLTTSDRSDGNTKQPLLTRSYGSFTASAGEIDLERGVIHARRTTLDSTGDVRVVGVVGDRPASGSTQDSFGFGGVLTSGRLTIDAAQIYPTGGSEGAIESLYPSGKSGSAALTIRSDGAAAPTPLSAGGTLYLLAQTIEQGGIVRAPGGTIVLGRGSGPYAVTATFFSPPGTAPPTVVPARSVTLEPGSITSVSLDGASLPYGGTVDGKAWYYADTTRGQSPLIALPAKQVSIDASTIAVASGADVDLSGSGDLYASEFVAGNGGSRDVLSPNSATTLYTSTAFQPGAVGNVALDNAVTQVYAILPGDNPSIAPTDVDFATASGFANPAPPPGLSITVSASPGLAAGTYTLLPAPYATLPGAERVVIVPNSSNFQPSQNVTLPDGTQAVSARIATPLAGGQTETGSTTLEVEIQSSAVWRQYSEIDQASANAFFPSYDAGQGDAVTRLPRDAGELTLTASQSLNLSGTLANGAATDGLGSIVEIVAGDTEIVDPGATARSGYIAISADQLTSLDAGLLLIGGTATTSTDGFAVTPTSDAIEVANDAAHPLAGPNIVLVTTGDPATAESGSFAGIQLDRGAAIEASGAAATTTAAIDTLTIGVAGTSAKAPGIRGDGALIAVGNGAPIVVDRLNLQGAPGSFIAGTPLGTIAIGAGATVAGGNGLTIDTANQASIDPTAALSGSTVELSATSIELGAAPAGSGGLALPGAIVQELGRSENLTLRSAAAIEVFGSTSLDETATGSTLTLDANALIANGGAIGLSAGTVTFADTLSLAADATTAPSTASLAVTAGAVDFAPGIPPNGGATDALPSQSTPNGIAFDGFASIALDATGQVASTGNGRVDLRGAALTVTTPQILAATGSTLTLVTTGTVDAAIGSGQAAGAGAGDALGGDLSVTASAIAIDNRILAPAGSISLDATSGNLGLGSNATLDAAGYAQIFFDTVRYAGGGTLRLTADRGSIVAASGSVLDVAGSSAGGDGGTLVLDAPNETVTLAGKIEGAASAGGTGASFTLAQAAAAQLDALTALLAGGGFSGTVDISTASGALALTQGTLSAQNVTLNAAGGAISIGAGTTIDASGDQGGTIQLFGARGVDIEGGLLARGSDPSQAGGIVEIASKGSVDAANPTDASYGYENIVGAGAVTLGAHSVIDVSGGTIGGLTGGTVQIRVPLLENGSIPLAAAAGATITGATSRGVEVDAYATWSTDDVTTGPRHFDGIVDPAGWYSATGSLLAGTDQNGALIAAGSVLAPGTYYQPSTPNADHLDFYQTTLLNFVEGFSVANAAALAAVPGLHLQPGIDLVNPDMGINNGDVTVATAWNLGAGGYDASGVVNLFYRTGAGEPGVLSLRAVNNVAVDASLTDGFFQTQNTLSPAYEKDLGNYLSGNYASAGDSTIGNFLTPLEAPVAPYDTSDSGYQTALGAYFSTYSLPQKLVQGNLKSDGYLRLWEIYFQQENNLADYPLSTATPSALPSGLPALPTAPQQGTFATYSAYVQAYQAYVPTYDSYLTALGNALAACTTCTVFQPPPAPAAPAAPNMIAAGVGSGSSDYVLYARTYSSTYAVAYNNYVGQVSSVLGLGSPARQYAPTALADGSDQIFQAPTALTAPIPYGNIVSAPAGGSTLTAVSFDGANGPSPNAAAADPNPVLQADLVPANAISNVGHAANQGSWSFNITGGADVSSADPTAVSSLENFAADTGGAYTQGTVTLNGYTTYVPTKQILFELARLAKLPQGGLTGLVPTEVRTGTGSIDIAAGSDFALTSTIAQAAVYTAGAVTAPLPDAGLTEVNGGSALNGAGSLASGNSRGGSGQFGGDGTGTSDAANPNGFQAPDFGDPYQWTAFVLTSPTLYAVNQPAYPDFGGSVTITAQHDILARQNNTAPKGEALTTTSGYLSQYWSSWLLTRSAPISAGGFNFNASNGVYDPNTPRGGLTSDLTDGQTTWWINYGSFDQGAAALGGGNVTIGAGGDIVEFSASTASTGRVTGGLSSSSTTGVVIYGGGDLTVTAGGDILSGTYYTALGKATIAAAGSIEAEAAKNPGVFSYSYTDKNINVPATVTVSPSTIFALGDAQMVVKAGGSIDAGDIVNPTELSDGGNLIVSDNTIAHDGGASEAGFANSVWTENFATFNTYSPQSAISLEAGGGNVTLLSLPVSTATSAGRNILYTENYRLLPASLDVSSLRGDILVESNFDQTNASSGNLALLADQNVRLVGPDNGFGADVTSTIPLAGAEAGIATYQTANSQTISTLDPFPGLVDSAFDPNNPVAGYNAPTSYILLYANGSTPSQVYALNGDISNGEVLNDLAQAPASSLPMPILSDKQIDVRAGRDILNLQLYAQDNAAGDVTAVAAGRDIVYNLPEYPALFQQGGTFPTGDDLIELAGPGTLTVSAGRNLGPFPHNFNDGPSGIVTTGNNAWIPSYIDPKLSSIGASINVFAGVAGGIDYQAVIQDYVNPANAANVPHNYIGALETYLSETEGASGLSASAALALFETLPAQAQEVFVDQVFFEELVASQSGASPDYARGYRMVNTLFPGGSNGLGYTLNNLGGGTNGANKLVQTGNVDLRSATIQTKHGGSILVYAPGGNIVLGSTVSRAIYNQPGSTGILTFQGGAIDIFSDDSLVVNQSRILTEEGGDVVIWSSNGDILAGIGTKTSADFPPYSVLFDQDGLQSLDPAGLVTGAGIGALVTIPGQNPADSNAYLIAPRGTVDAGDAGIRVGGNLTVAALHVANASNIQVGGKAVGVPTAPTVALPSIASAVVNATNAAQAEDQDQLSSGRSGNQTPSIITIDVTGFGG